MGFIEKAKSLYGDRFDYTSTIYINSSTNVKIKCLTHGVEFSQHPRSHLLGYHGCPLCKSSHKKSDAYKDLGFFKKVLDVHQGKFEYFDDYINSRTPIKIRCIKHNTIFLQKPSVHLRGFSKCPLCYQEKMQSVLGSTQEEFISKSIGIHGNRYDYTNTEYLGSRVPVTITCKEHGDFDQVAYYHLAGNGCPKCTHVTPKSKSELEILEFVSSLGVDAKSGDRTLISPLEIDILIESHKLAIEFNGLYWHSSGSIEDDSEKEKQHVSKTNQVESLGYTLFHIFENEWNNKRPIVESMIRSRLGMCRKIPARKCDIELIDRTTAADFFEKNHLQGQVSGSVYYGLTYCGELVSVVSFGKTRYTNADWELLRLASKNNTTVQGGASRLIHHFRKNHSGSIVSYANRRWSIGNVYDKLGFELVGISKPCYWYINVNTGSLYHRSSFMKHKLQDKLEFFDVNKTERENMYCNKYRRIWDCGNKVYVLNEI